MKRRTVIASVATAAFGGCLDRATGGRSVPDSNERNVRIENVDRVDNLPVSIEVEAVTKQSTEAHPARFEIEFRNESEATMTVDFGPTPPFSSIKSAEDGQLLLLASNHDYSAKEAGRWEPDLDDDALIAQDDVMVQARIPPDNVVDGEYELWNAPNTAKYLPPDSYRFEESYTVAYDDTETEFDWSFTVGIE